MTVENFQVVTVHSNENDKLERVFPTEQDAREYIRDQIFNLYIDRYSVNTILSMNGGMLSDVSGLSIYVLDVEEYIVDWDRRQKLEEERREDAKRAQTVLIAEQIQRVQKARESALSKLTDFERKVLGV